MKSVNWQNGQRIIKQVLEWFSSAKDQNDQEYRQDTTQAGIILDALNEMDIIVGANNTPATPSITVRTGVAYDSSGERIYIPDENLSYDATNPSDTTDDGRGVFLPTPHSTGSKNIPLTINSFNYIWVTYLQVIDESLFTLQTATNAKQFYKKDNGYSITVTTVNTPPTASSVYLGSVNLTGFGVVSGSTISTTGRTYSLIKENRVKIKTPLANLSDATTTYGFNQEHTLDEHIKAVGNGAITPQNPHGITLADIGVDVEAVVANHQKFMHSNGMIGSKTTLVSSLYPEFHPITPGDDFLIVKALSATEVVNIDGITVTSSDVPSDTTFLFSSLGDASGTYYIYLDKFTKSLIRTTVNPTSDITKFPVVSMVWTAGVPALYDGNLTSITDLRVFGTINNDKIDNKDEYEMVSLHLEDGTVSAPSLRWQSDLTTGIYRSGSGIISFSSNGVLSANISGGQVSAVDGTISLPSYSFLSDSTTGIYHGGTNRVDLVSGSINTLTSSTSGLDARFTDGLVGSPSMAFLSDPDTGIYRSGSGIISFASNGVLSANISGGQISAVNGSASLPSYGFLNDTNTGLFSQADDTIRITTGGVERFDINTQMLSTSDGSNTVPTYSFTSEPNTGMYKNGTSVAFTRAGTLLTSLDSGGVNIWTGGVTVQNGTGRIFNNDGSVSAPAYSFKSAGSTWGMYKTAGGLSFSVSSADILSLSSTGSVVSSNLRTTGILSTDFGTASLPTHTFAFDSNTGMYRSASGELSLTANGTQTASFTSSVDTFYTSGVNRLQISTSSITKTLPILGEAGSSAAATYSFTGDTNTGMFRVGASNLGFTVGGTKALDITSSRILGNSQFQAGSNTSGGYFFSADTATGVYYAPGITSMILRAGGVDQIDLGGSPNRIDIWNNTHVRVQGSLSNMALSVGGSFASGFYDPGFTGELWCAGQGVDAFRVSNGGVRFTNDAYADDNARIWAYNNTANSAGLSGTGFGQYMGNARFGTTTFDVNGNVGECGQFTHVCYKDDGTGSHVRIMAITTASGSASITALHDIASGSDPGTASVSITVNGGGSGIHRVTYSGPTTGPCLGYYMRWH